MPKRSNDFQRLVKRVYDQLAPSGAVVTESASLPDYGENNGPEIDILVEFPVSGTTETFKVAIECRDHARRSDKLWIDQIIGKYRDIPVDRVIAISRSEFTRGARKKAKQGKVELRTLMEALDTDWPKELMLIGVGQVELHPEIGLVEIHAIPPWTTTLEPVAVKLGDRWIDQNDFKHWLQAKIVAEFSAEVEREKAKGSTRLDGYRRYEITLEVRVDPLTFRSAHGSDHAIDHLVLCSAVTRVERMLPVRRYRLGEIGVSEAPTRLGREPAVLVVIQEPGREPKVKLVPTSERR